MNPTLLRSVGFIATGLAVSTAVWTWAVPNAESHATPRSATQQVPTEVHDEGQRWIADRPLVVRTQPTHGAPMLARIPQDEPFIVVERVEGAACPEGWAQTDGDGFTCLAGARPTAESPVRLPRLVRFVHPDPREWDRYMETMTYDTAPEDRIDAMVPFIYAKRWGQWTGPNYASAASFGRGEAPIQRLNKGRKYHFVDAQMTSKGAVLQRENGAVVPAESVHIYPLTKFHGWDTRAEPIPSGYLPAWAISYDGTPVRDAPSVHASVGSILNYHDAILVEDQPVDRGGHWWMMPNGLGPGVPGYVNDTDGIRHWTPSPPPIGVGPTELWVDVDVDQQVLALRRGTDLEFVTLVSTGKPDTPTPRGLFRIKSKTAWGDMASRPDSDDPYYVEKVPWVMHFKHRYALHGTFWHWGFGHTASHGCINLSVRDARWLYDRVNPVAYGGWHHVEATPEHPGTTIRIRRGVGPVPDRRGG
ncbi:MAG: L,D-transpeptidase [Myxococcota bacterium]|nr:L,D-transpeptidase [Myxococcota bacterium]MEC9389699.1 L,D-transpeptidase [Myxococcota bacterium]